MGLIKKAFGAIFGLLAAIFKGVLGIFGIGKSDYYLELDESQEDRSQAAQPTSEQQPQSTPEQSSSAKPAQTAKEQPAKPDPAPAGQAAANQSANKAASQPQGPPAQSTGSPLSQPSGMALASAKADTSSTGTFATDYLVNSPSSSGGRRRPGPCLSSFKDMARQVQPSGN